MGRAKPILISLLLCLAAAALAPAGAAAATETATLGNVTAELSYDQVSNPAPMFANAHVTIIRNGVTMIDEPAVPEPGSTSGATIGPGYGGQSPSVHVLRLNSGAEPGVVFDLFSGGAHCCFYSMIFTYSASGNSYTLLTHDFLDAGYTFADLNGDGASEFESDDARFGYAFSAFADSQFPIQIWSSGVDGSFTDVTRTFPAEIQSDLQTHLRSYKRGKGRHNVQPALAAATADDCLLGRCGAGFKLVRAASRRGYLAVGVGGLSLESKRFPSKLRHLLRHLGYL